MPKEFKSFSDNLDDTFVKMFKKDKSIIMMGLGINDPKKIFNTTDKVSNKFPNRVFDVPISENSISGIAIGCALNNLKPILTHQRLDFSLLTLDQIVNQAAKWFYMFDGKKNVPLVIRLIVGRGWGQGPQHSQSLHSFFSHIPGLKVVMPSTSESVGPLMEAAIKDPNPVIFIEHRWLHSLKSNNKVKNKIKELGKAEILKKGKDITIVSCSYMTIEVLRISEFLKKNNIDFELIDLQSVSPLDYKTILNSVKKTKRLLVLDIGHKSFGISAEIISIVSEKLITKMKYSPQRIALPDIPTPTTFVLAKDYYPSKYDITKKIFTMCGLKRKLPKNTFGNDLYKDQPFKEFTGPF